MDVERALVGRPCAAGALPKEWEEESACEYVGACAPILEKVGIGCTFAPVPHHLIQLLVRQQIEPNLRRRAIQAGVAEEVAANPIAHLPPVLVDGIPLEFATHLFDVTAALHDSNVWTSLPPNVAYKVGTTKAHLSCEQASKPGSLSNLGMGGAQILAGGAGVICAGAHDGQGRSGEETSCTGLRRAGQQ